jgi:hypothetical protein
MGSTLQNRKIRKEKRDVKADARNERGKQHATECHTKKVTAAQSNS